MEILQFEKKNGNFTLNTLKTSLKNNKLYIEMV